MFKELLKEFLKEKEGEDIIPIEQFAEWLDNKLNKDDFKEWGD